MQLYSTFYNGIIESENLLLRPWKKEDAECLYHFAKNPKIGPIAGWPPHESIEDSLSVIDTVFSKDETYAIVKDDVPIGSIAILTGSDANHDWGDASGELGYWIAEDYWGNGFAFEASEALLKHAFHDLNLDIIYATYRIENSQSKRVLEKLGFKYCDLMNNTNYNGETFIEVAMYLKKY